MQLNVFLKKPKGLDVGASFTMQGAVVVKVTLHEMGPWVIEGESLEEISLNPLITWVEAYCAGIHLPPPIGVLQNEFMVLQTIPFGSTISYKEYAKLLGKPAAIRASASKLQHNPVPLLLPCHRVIRSDGSIGGFMGKQSQYESIKKQLLTVELKLKA